MDDVSHDGGCEREGAEATKRAASSQAATADTIYHTAPYLKAQSLQFVLGIL